MSLVNIVTVIACFIQSMKKEEDKDKEEGPDAEKKAVDG